MKRWQFCLLLLTLAGCSQTDNRTQKELHPTNDAQPSCVDSLYELDEKQFPNTYQRAFENCQEPINKNELVKRYVFALVLTGQYQALTSKDVFSENVAPDLAEYWTHWIEGSL